MNFYRILVTALVVFCLVLVLSQGFWFAVATWAVCSCTLWAVLTLCELFVRVGTALSRPSVHIHTHVEPHPDPTRPDELEDLLPYVIVNRKMNGSNNGHK